MKNFLKMFGKSIFAGILIGIAGWGFLVNPLLGMFLFCVGLIGVVKYRAKLYTGTAGFMTGWSDLPSLFMILIGNIIGCLIIAAIALYSPLDLATVANEIMITRLSVGWLGCGLLAIDCGILMSFAVQFARYAELEVNEHFSNWLPLLFAVPTFILCGFPHCIADAFYCMLYIFNTQASAIPIGSLLAYYGSIVAGNFIGCNLYRVFIID